MKLCLIFNHFQIGSTLRSRLTLPEVIPEVEYARNIAMDISDILSFLSML